MSKRRFVLPGSLMVATAALLGKETIALAWEQTLGKLVAAMGNWDMGSAPWRDIAAFILFITGLVLLFWEPLSTRFKRKGNAVAALAGEFDGFKEARQRDSECIRMHLAVVDRRLGEIEARLDPGPKEA